MKIATATVLNDLDGDPIKDGEKDLTVGRALSGALITAVQGQEDQTPAQAADKYDLAMKLRNQKEVNLSSEQVTLCKEMVAKVYAPIISGQIVKLLEK